MLKLTQGWALARGVRLVTCQGVTPAGGRAASAGGLVSLVPAQPTASGWSKSRSATAAVEAWALLSCLPALQVLPLY